MNPQDSQIHCCWVTVSLIARRTGYEVARLQLARMSVPRPASGEELNEGPETPPRVAASVIVLRDSPDGPEVLLVQRNPEARFMGGAWVFPGGTVSGDESPAQAGRRELLEEAGLELPGGDEEL